MEHILIRSVGFFVRMLYRFMLFAALLAGLDIFIARGVSAQALEVPTVYQVNEGETIYDIVRRYNLSLKVVADINGLKKPYDMSKGMVLLLPQPLFHRVSAGETARSIANLHEVNLDEFTRINSLEAPDFEVRVGQDLMLPGSVQEGLVQRASGTDTVTDEDIAVFGNPLFTDDAEDEITIDEVEAGKPSDKDVAARKSNSNYIWPARGDIVREFGELKSGVASEGIDIAVAEGTQVRAVAPGSVAYSGNDLAAYGNLILIKHDDGFVSAYAHNSQLVVGENKRVKQGDIIALSGSTGEVSGPRLHFELRRGRLPVNPLDYLGKF